MFLGDVGFYQSLVRYEVAGHNIMAEPIGERLLRAGLVYGWGGAGHWSPVRAWLGAPGSYPVFPYTTRFRFIIKDIDCIILYCFYHDYMPSFVFDLLFALLHLNLSCF